MWIFYYKGYMLLLYLNYLPLQSVYFISETSWEWQYVTILSEDFFQYVH
jgi:hypothetical protein